MCVVITACRVGCVPARCVRGETCALERRARGDCRPISFDSGRPVELRFVAEVCDMRQRTRSSWKAISLSIDAIATLFRASRAFLFRSCTWDGERWASSAERAA